MSEFKQFKVIAETAFPGASQFESFILLLQLGFELQRFEPPIDTLVFLAWKLVSGDRLPPKFEENVVPFAPHLSYKFHDFIFSRFEVLAISASGYRKIVNFARKKTKLQN